MEYNFDGARNILQKLARQKNLTQQADGQQVEQIQPRFGGNNMMRQAFHFKTSSISSEEILQNLQAPNTANTEIQIACELCLEQISFESYTDHVENKCQQRLGKCSDCNEEYPISMLEDHAPVCPKKNVQLIGQGQNEENKQPHENSVLHVQNSESNMMVECSTCKRQVEVFELVDHQMAHYIETDNQNVPSEQPSNQNLNVPQQQPQVGLSNIESMPARQGEMNSARNGTTVEQFRNRLIASLLENRNDGQPPEIIPNIFNEQAPPQLQRRSQRFFFGNSHQQIRSSSQSNVYNSRQPNRQTRELREQITELRNRIQNRNDGYAFGKNDPTELKNALPTFKYEQAQFQNCKDHSNDKVECIICMEDFEENDDLRQLQCFHHFHSKCIDKWLESSKKCPLCQHKQEISN